MGIHMSIKMKNDDDLIAEALPCVKEIMPWDLSKRLASDAAPVLLDVREACEFVLLRIPGSINVPRGVLEQSCEWDYDETLPMLAADRAQEIVLICRSGQTTGGAAQRLVKAGFEKVYTLGGGMAAWQQAQLPVAKGSK